MVRSKQEIAKWATVKDNDVIQDPQTKLMYRFARRLGNECYLEPVGANKHAKLHVGIWVPKRAFDKRELIKVS